MKVRDKGYKENNYTFIVANIPGFAGNPDFFNTSLIPSGSQTFPVII